MGKTVRWRAWTQRFVTLPWLLRAGILLLALGGAGDVVVHVVGGLPHEVEHAMHLVTLVGMVGTLAGILLEAAD